MTRHDLQQLRLYAHTALLRSERSWRAWATPSRALVAWFVDNAGRLECPPLPPLDRADIELGLGDVDART